MLLLSQSQSSMFFTVLLLGLMVTRFVLCYYSVLKSPGLFCVITQSQRYQVCTVLLFSLITKSKDLLYVFTT